MASDDELVARAKRIATIVMKKRVFLLWQLPAWVQKEAYYEAVCAVVGVLAQRWEVQDEVAVQEAMRQIDWFVQREYRHYKREGTSLPEEGTEECETDSLAVEGSGEEVERELDVQEALRQLPEKLRRVAELRFCQQYQIQEIAMELQVSVSTVKRRIEAARVLLRRMLSGYGGRNEK